MKQYQKTIDGKTVKKKASEIVIRKSGMATTNPTEELILADGWEEYVPPVYTPTEAELLARAKERMVRHIEDYDDSEEVNDCIIIKEGVEMNYWADKEERDSLKGAVRDCISVGRETYRLDLRDLGISLHIPCEALLQMLSALEVYAIDSYNKTTDHIYAVNALTTIEEVEAYDYHIGYPEKLTFNL